MDKLLISVLLLAAVGVAQAGTAVQLNINGGISPITSHFIERGFETAKDQKADLIILYMNTPGGLDKSMRSIVQVILASPIPVVTYVAPGGARAASAGTYILYASHVAAMAPGTNLGAATPVQIGGGGGLPGPKQPDKSTPEVGKDEQPKKPLDNAMKHKVVNDAVAYLRSLAQLRKRNVEWAEKAVREAASLPAEEALKAGVIDLMAHDLPDLLALLDGRQIMIAGELVTLETQGMTIRLIEPDWRTELLSVIADPNIAYLLIIVGIYGLIFEFYNPGMILPGVVGAICLILALFALQVLPVNYAGLGLIILGIIFMVAEAFAPSFGVFGFGGVIAFLIGSIILMDPDVPGYGISLPLIFSLTAVSAVFFLGVIGMAIKARTRPIVSGQEELVGALGVVNENFVGNGRIRIHGEIWNAKFDGSMKAGQWVRVTRLDGLVLHIEPQKEKK
jgi:membrane-bound serine protease (ClpP class)